MHSSHTVNERIHSTCHSICSIYSTYAIFAQDREKTDAGQASVSPQNNECTIRSSATTEANSSTLIKKKTTKKAAKNKYKDSVRLFYFFLLFNSSLLILFNFYLIHGLMDHLRSSSFRSFVSFFRFVLSFRSSFRHSPHPSPKKNTLPAVTFQFITSSCCFPWHINPGFLVSPDFHCKMMSLKFFFI